MGTVDWLLASNEDIHPIARRPDYWHREHSLITLDRRVAILMGRSPQKHFKT